ncbi:hypothetical protein BST19_26350, partial [Mycobacterium bouchedurhonense]
YVRDRHAAITYTTPRDAPNALAQLLTGSLLWGEALCMVEHVLRCCLNIAGAVALRADTNIVEQDFKVGAALPERAQRLGIEQMRQMTAVALIAQEVDHPPVAGFAEHTQLVCSELLKPLAFNLFGHREAFVFCLDAVT